MTRKDYLDGTVTHEQYYRSVNKAAGITLVNHWILPRVREALLAKDENLNSIPLEIWDQIGSNPQVNGYIDKALRQHDDYATKASVVCCFKQAAKDAVKIEDWIQGN